MLWQFKQTETQTVSKDMLHLKHLNKAAWYQDSCNLITHHYVQENGDSVGWVKFHFHLSFDAM